LVLQLEYLMTSHGKQKLIESEVAPRYHLRAKKIDEEKATIQWDYLLKESQKVDEGVGSSTEVDDLPVGNERIEEIELPSSLEYYEPSGQYI
jgi:hypothetical protein